MEGPGVWQTLGKKKTREKKGGEEKKKGTGVWQTLGKKKENKKKEYIHTHSYTHVVVHISMYDGEEA